MIPKQERRQKEEGTQEAGKNEIEYLRNRNLQIILDHLTQKWI